MQVGSTTLVRMFVRAICQSSRRISALALRARLGALGKQTTFKLHPAALYPPRLLVVTYSILLTLLRPMPT
jgi:hypothetical protein